MPGGCLLPHAPPNPLGDAATPDKGSSRSVAGTTLWQYPHKVADEFGALCAPSQVTSTGCCSERKHLHSCEGCTSRATSRDSNDDECCKTYEACVSCCMSPDNTVTNMQGLVRRRKTQAVYNTVPDGDTWKYCLTRCRTSSLSVLNQNRYRSPFHFCYGANPSN
eukprot:Sspe_Gene.25656::Locus_10356_Transcript_1_4_Confidence_0.750_Length_717::g.25656::m.25656